MLTDEQIEQVDKMNYVAKCELAYSVDNVGILEYLSNHGLSNIRYRVAKNVRTPVRILVKLLNDKIDFVREAANEQLKKYNINLNKHTTKGILE